MIRLTVPRFEDHILTRGTEQIGDVSSVQVLIADGKTKKSFKKGLLVIDITSDSSVGWPIVPSK